MDDGQANAQTPGKRQSRPPFDWRHTTASDWQGAGQAADPTELPTARLSNSPDDRAAHRPPPDPTELPTARLPSAAGREGRAPTHPPAPEQAPAGGAAADPRHGTGTPRGGTGAPRATSEQWLADVVGDIATAPLVPPLRPTAPPGGSTRQDWRDAHWEQLGNGGYLPMLSRPTPDQSRADLATRELPVAALPRPDRRGAGRYPELEGGPLGPGFWARLQEVTGLGMLRPRVRAEVSGQLAVRMWRRLAALLLLLATLAVAATMLAQAHATSAHHQPVGLLTATASYRTW